MRWTQPPSVLVIGTLYPYFPITTQLKEMIALHSCGGSPLTLRFCHPLNSLSPKLPFLLLLPPTQFPSLRNSIPHSNYQRPTSLFLSGSVIRAMAASTTPSTESKPSSVLFVCLGNICRSPAAEGVFTDLVKKRGLDSKFKIDSAGTINYHEVCVFSLKR